jgi:O-antigen/teichoic acid export membrane protein
VVFLSTALLGFSDVAMLGFAYKFTKDALGAIWTPLTGVMTPLLVRIKSRENLSALRDAHASLTRLILLLVMPAGLWLALLAPRLVATLYPNYTAATPLIPVFILFAFTESILSVPHNTLMVHERYRPLVASRLLTLLSLPLILIVVPRFGAMGVAVVVGIMRVLPRLVTFAAGVRLLGLRFPLGFAGRIAIASGAFVAALALLPGQGAATAVAGSGLAPKLIALAPLAAMALLGVVLYAVALRATGGLHQDERRRILALPLPFKNVLLHVL